MNKSALSALIRSRAGALGILVVCGAVAYLLSSVDVSFVGLHTLLTSGASGHELEHIAACFNSVLVPCTGST